MSVRSTTDVAYEIVSKKEKEVAFNQLWNEVCEVMGYNANQAMNKIASFYSAMMLDARFANLADNTWDLKSRHTYDETHINTSDLIIEDDIVKDDIDDIEFSEIDDEGFESRPQEEDSDDNY